MPFGPASLLGVERFSQESEAPLELIPGDDDAKKEQIIRAVYKQVLGNAYVMESERQLVAESQFKLGEISVRELVRRIAKSELYRERFFDACSRYRYIELAFRHLLGRAPVDFDEMRAHAERLDNHGYDADIDSFLDSCRLPGHLRRMDRSLPARLENGSLRHPMQEFTWSFQLLRGNSSSSLKGDLSGISSKLGGNAYQNRPMAVVAPSSTEPGGWSFRPAKNLQDAPTRHGVGAGDQGKTYRVEVTAYSANNVRRISRYTRSNRVYFVPFDKLSEQFKRIHAEGGKISSITPVN